jgi:hypothetical protein
VIYLFAQQLKVSDAVLDCARHIGRTLEYLIRKPFSSKVFAEGIRRIAADPRANATAPVVVFVVALHR